MTAETWVEDGLRHVHREPAELNYHADDHEPGEPALCQECVLDDEDHDWCEVPWCECDCAGEEYDPAEREIETVTPTGGLL